MNMGIQGSFSPYSAYSSYGSFAVSGQDDSKPILKPGESTEKKPGLLTTFSALYCAPSC